MVASEATAEYGPVDARVAAIFDLMDKNSDGSLSKAECLIALRKQENVREALGISSVTEGDGKEKFDAMFAKMDADGNASISLTELNAFLKEMLPAAESNADEAAPVPPAPAEEASAAEEAAE